MRPGGLIAVCVIALCLGLLGLFGATMQCLGAVLQSAILDFAQNLQPGGMPGPQFQQQLQLQQEIMAVQSRWLPFTIGLTVLNAIASLSLIVASILGFCLNPRTNQWFVPTLSCAIVHSLLYVVLTAGMQHEMQAVMAKQMAQMMQQGGTPPPPGSALMMSNAMKASSAIGIAVVGGWALLQIVFYATALWYLLQQDVRSLFMPPSLDELAAEPTIGGLS
jgi:hypothetical protein